jgi:hypothetical protein
MNCYGNSPSNPATEDENLPVAEGVVSVRENGHLYLHRE